MKTYSEIPFRICFGVLWLLYFAIRIYFQAKVTGKRVILRTNEKQEFSLLSHICTRISFTTHLLPDPLARLRPLSSSRLLALAR